MKEHGTKKWSSASQNHNPQDILKIEQTLLRILVSHKNVCRKFCLTSRYLFLVFLILDETEKLVMKFHLSCYHRLFIIYSLVTEEQTAVIKFRFLSDSGDFKLVLTIKKYLQTSTLTFSLL